MNESVYKELANAIILQAVKDYRKALRENIKYPYRKECLHEIRSIEHFFRSAWFSTLTSLDGKLLCTKLREEVSA